MSFCVVLNGEKASSLLQSQIESGDSQANIRHFVTYGEQTSPDTVSIATCAPMFGVAPHDSGRDFHIEEAISPF